jgi:hypothetical protein
MKTMKIKNINALKDKFEQVTSGIKINEEGNYAMSIRYDAYEELVYVSEDEQGKEITLSVAEARKLRNALNSLL